MCVGSSFNAIYHINDDAEDIIVKFCECKNLVHSGRYRLRSKNTGMLEDFAVKEEGNKIQDVIKCDSGKYVLRHSPSWQYKVPHPPASLLLATYYP